MDDEKKYVVRVEVSGENGEVVAFFRVSDLSISEAMNVVYSADEVSRGV